MYKETATQINNNIICIMYIHCRWYYTNITFKHTLLLIGVNLVFKQCIQVWASLSGTHTAACSVAGLLLPVGMCTNSYENGEHYW